MPGINMNAILEKAKRAVSSPSFQKRIEQKIDAVMAGNVSSGASSIDGRHHVIISGMSVAAGKFIEVLQNEIMSCDVGSGGGFSEGGLGPTAVHALCDLEHSEPYKVGKNRYQISVWFKGDLSRESLVPGKYEDVENIAALLNSGYSAGHRVYGVWKGHGDARQASIAERGGAHFIESAIRNYMANYASEYGVIGINVDDVYK